MFQNQQSQSPALENAATPDPPALCLPERVNMYTEVCVQHVCTAKTHLVPEGWLSLDPPLGALELSPAVALPLLAQMPPRVNCLLKKEQPPTASKVKEE